MRVLIVEGDLDLAREWASRLTKMDADVHLCDDAEEAAALLADIAFDVLIIDLDLAGDAALSVGDLAQFWQPTANVIFVSGTSVFSDGSIFRHSRNARVLLKRESPPDDLAAIAFHYGQISRGHEERQSQFAG